MSETTMGVDGRIIEAEKLVQSWLTMAEGQGWSDAERACWSVAAVKLRAALGSPTGGIAGAALIAQERQRQIDEEGRTPVHDLTHKREELAWAAACYAAPETIYVHSETGHAVHFTEPWPTEWTANANRGEPGRIPWRRQLPGDRLRNLVKAGALIAAEIDRLLPAAASQTGDER